MKNSLKKIKEEDNKSNKEESINEIIFEKRKNKLDWHFNRAFANLKKIDQLKQWKDIMSLKKPSLGTDIAFVFKDETSWNEINHNIVKVSKDRYLYPIFKYLCNFLPTEDLLRVEKAFLKIDDIEDNYISKNILFSLIRINDQNVVLMEEIKENVYKLLLAAYKKIDKLEKEMDVLKARNKNSYDHTLDAFVKEIINYIKINKSYPDMARIESLFPGQTSNQIKIKLNSVTYKSFFLTKLIKLIKSTKKGIRKINKFTTPDIKRKNEEINKNTKNKILAYIQIYNSKSGEWELPEYSDDK